MKIAGNSPISLGMILSATPMLATAQNMSFGADNFYRSSNVTRHPITFQDQYQMDIAGNLFISNSFNRSVKSNTGVHLPAIIIGHPMGAVKEQASNLYAQKLAEQGFVTVSLDLPFWGSSEGEPRNAVLPDLYAEAFSAAVDYLGTQKFVDPERIGAVGICGSGSFVISAAKIDPRLKAIATSSMYNMGDLAQHGLGSSQSLEERKEVIRQAAEQRWTEINGGKVQYTGGTVLELTANSTAIEREFYDFYRTKRAEFTPPRITSNITTRPTLSSNTKFANFYPFNDIDTISPRPMLFIAGDQAHSRYFSEDAYERAAEPKELFWVPGAGHADLYDRVQLIPFDKLTQFFRKNLA